MNKVYRERASTVCIRGGELLVFKGIDPTSKKEYWFLPGGAIEPSETAAECALRETYEETGYPVRLTKQSPLLKEFEFVWDGVLWHSKTHFFRAELADPARAPDAVDDAAYNMGAHWLKLMEWTTAFGYANEILDAIRTLSKEFEF